MCVCRIRGKSRTISIGSEKQNRALFPSDLRNKLYILVGLFFITPQYYCGKGVITLILNDSVGNCNHRLLDCFHRVAKWHSVCNLLHEMKGPIMRKAAAAIGYF